MSQFRSYGNNFPPIVKNIIILNVLAWLAQLTLDARFDITDRGALWGLGRPAFAPFHFEPYQVVTYMFLHGSFMHILFNMLALFFVGRMLENRWGPKRFLIFYLACGVGVGLVHLCVQYVMGHSGPAIGASGAIMGVVVAFAYLFPNTEFIIIPFPFPVKAKWLATIYILYDLFLGFNAVEGDNVAHFAHLGGALTGFIIVFIWNKTNRKTFY